MPRKYSNQKTILKAKAVAKEKTVALVEKLNEVVDYVTDLVQPRKRAELHLKKWHKTQLTGTKLKTQKQKNKQKTKSQSKNLSRKQFAELGLYTLPTKCMKYVEMLPMHELWLQYIFDHLRIYLTDRNGQHMIPNVNDSNYDAFSKALVKSDFHGARVTVVASCNPSLVGQSGIVAMETRNTFIIVGIDDRIRTIPKMESIFKILVKDIEFKIFGKYLNIRPAERSVKKIKNFMEPDL